MKHLTTLRTKSIGGWFMRIKHHPKSFWVLLGNHGKYESINLPSYHRNFEGETGIRLFSYRIPQYLLGLMRTTYGFDEKFVDTMNLVAMLKVDIIDLGKGKYPKIRPYSVRMTDDAIRIMEKRCWEMTGDDSIYGKVWRFDQDAHPTWQHEGLLKSHVKYTLRDSMRVVEKFDAFSMDDFDWDASTQMSLQQGLSFVVPEYEREAPRWCYSRVKFINALKARIQA